MNHYFIKKIRHDDIDYIDTNEISFFMFQFFTKVNTFQNKFLDKIASILADSNINY